MTWTLLIQLITQVGLPLAIKLYDKWSTDTVVTKEEIDELRALGAKTNNSQMIDALNRAGIALDSPEAVALLALIK